MADVWISRKRWTCNYCDVTINDDLPSRRHHETGVRHKQNVQKSLADLYRKGEQERKDAQHMQKEMARIEALAAESHAKDLAAGDGSVASSSQQAAVPTASSSSKSATPARGKPQSGVASLARQSTRPVTGETSHQPVAQPGQWEQVQPVSSASTLYANETSDRDKARSFRVREKVARLDDSDDESDLSSIKIKKRPRKDLEGGEGPSLLPTGVKKEEQGGPADSVKEEASAASQVDLVPGSTESSTAAVKKEESGETRSTAATKEQADSGNNGGASLFKKRRAGAGAGAKRVRAVI
ncbi:conserved hypothetical protein [Sporisorium reilianum SRZ2]|uniref:Matrin-type domain-containing protein n=1 Tax=Sporisorium reilianum (strain SRZ2) TaxID=999809 RepID=E6ZT15_SPORE|nr:conserved hypothetical protein [Sporisorium reilianum SRZ2]